MENPLTAQYTATQIAALEKQNHDSQVYVYVVIFTVLAVSATTVRLWCRQTRKSFGFDDALIILAMVDEAALLSKLILITRSQAMSIAQNIYIAIGWSSVA